MKSTKIISLIDEAKEIIQAVGIDIANQTTRRAERTAMALLAVAGVQEKWKEARSLKDGRKLKTREIIEFINDNFEEKISPGSYDDIRRKDLKKLVLAGLIINSGDNPNAAPNDPTRGYSLDHEFKELLISYGSNKWNDQLSKFNRLRNSLKNANLNTVQMPVVLPDGIKVSLTLNFHNSLQKAIIEEFLPRFGHNCKVLYLGDTKKRELINESKTLFEILSLSIGKEQLPDVIAYSKEKNWLFLIEAVTSGGPMSEERVLELNNLTKSCNADLIYVTTFLTKTDFRKWVDKIAWETEVWIADNPEHMIHFNGNKFLGPHNPT